MKNRDQQRLRLSYLWTVANTLQDTDPILSSHYGSTLLAAGGPAVVSESAYRFHCETCGALSSLARTRVRPRRRKVSKKGSKNTKNWVVTTCGICEKYTKRKAKGNSSLIEEKNEDVPDVTRPVEKKGRGMEKRTQKKKGRKEIFGLARPSGRGCQKSDVTGAKRKKRTRKRKPKVRDDAGEGLGASFLFKSL